MRSLKFFTNELNCASEGGNMRIRSLVTGLVIAVLFLGVMAWLTHVSSPLRGLGFKPPAVNGHFSEEIAHVLAATLERNGASAVKYETLGSGALYFYVAADWSFDGEKPRSLELRLFCYQKKMPLDIIARVDDEFIPSLKGADRGTYIAIATELLVEHLGRICKNHFKSQWE